MDWVVINALNRDVERQHLNKILADIRGTTDSTTTAVNKISLSNITKDSIGAEVTGGNQTGISVTYNNATKLVDFLVKSFTLTLTGAITGQATINQMGAVGVRSEPAAQGRLAAAVLRRA